MDILSLVFPKRCFGCGVEGKYLCQSCLAKNRIQQPVCPVCFRASVDGITHAGCLKPLGLNGLVCFWEYQGAIRKAILSLKYKFAFDIARELGLAMSAILKKEFNPLPKKGYLAPVPVFKDRANWRGFNQAEEIGKIITNEIGLKFIPELLLKKVKTKPQAGLDKKERLVNLRGVFSLNPKFNIQHSTPFILFDDILTTGTTLKEAAKTLKRAGASQVWGLVLARS